MTIIKKLILFTFLILFIFIFGCGVEKPNDILFYALKADPTTLNPIISSEIPSQIVNSTIFNSLLRYDDKMNIVMDLAESLNVEEDGKKWIFNLKKNVKWHDGIEFTSEDVIFTFEKLYDPNTNTFNRGLFTIGGKQLKVKALDKYTVEIILPEKFSPFESNLTTLGIIPKHILDGKDINRDGFNWSPIGTGPFKFKKWQSGEKIYVEKNENYFAGSPQLKGIVFQIIPSSESRRTSLITGYTDIGEITPEDLLALDKCDNLNIYSWNQFMYCYVGFDLTNPLFQDINLRKAINYATDKKSIISAVFKKNAVRALGPIPPASPYYDDSLPEYNFDPQKSIELLKDSGWKINEKTKIFEKDGKKLSFEVMYPSSNVAFEKAAVFMQAQMKQARIEMRLKSMEFSALINSCYPSKFESLIFDWVENFDPDNYTVWHSSQCNDDGMNFMSYKNKKVDELIEKGRITRDKKERIKIYSEIQKTIVNDSPYIFLWSPKGLVAVNKRIKGLSTPSPAGILVKCEKIYIKGEKI